MSQNCKLVEAIPTHIHLEIRGAYSLCILIYMFRGTEFRKTIGKESFEEYLDKFHWKCHTTFHNHLFSEDRTYSLIGKKTR